MSLRIPLARVAIGSVVLATLLTPQSARAFWVVISMKTVVTGSWSLLGVKFEHSQTRLCFLSGIGDLPPEYQNSGVPVDPLTPIDDLALTDLRLYGGPGALAELGGDPVIFDDTMFPPPPDYDFDTLGGTEFNINFHAPLATVGGDPMPDLPGVFVSSRLPLGDPNLILGEATLANGLRFPIQVLAVPEPDSLWLGTSAAAILGSTVARRRRRHAPRR